MKFKNLDSNISFILSKNIRKINFESIYAYIYQLNYLYRVVNMYSLLFGVDNAYMNDIILAINNFYKREDIYNFIISQSENIKNLSVENKYLIQKFLKKIYDNKNNKALVSAETELQNKIKRKIKIKTDTIQKYLHINRDYLTINKKNFNILMKEIDDSDFRKSFRQTYFNECNAMDELEQVIIQRNKLGKIENEPDNNIIKILTQNIEKCLGKLNKYDNIVDLIHDIEILKNKNIFKIKNVFPTVLELVSKFFKLHIRKSNNISKWNANVETYQVLIDDEVKIELYIDIFQYEEKKDIQTVALLLQDIFEDEPSKIAIIGNLKYVTYVDIVNLFREFGRALQLGISTYVENEQNKNKYYCSYLLEQYAWKKNTIDKFKIGIYNDIQQLYNLYYYSNFAEKSFIALFDYKTTHYKFKNLNDLYNTLQHQFFTDTCLFFDNAIDPILYETIMFFGNGIYYKSIIAEIISHSINEPHLFITESHLEKVFDKIDPIVNYFSQF